MTDSRGQRGNSVKEEIEAIVPFATGVCWDSVFSNNFGFIDDQLALKNFRLDADQ
jgi:hypothetical protein